MKPETPTIMLFWVKAEIDHALKGIREKIAQYNKSEGDISLLRGCPAQLHQVAGALRIFDLMGVLRFTEAVESAFANVISSGKAAPKIVELLDRSIRALGEFVDGLSKGALNAPLSLYPLYRELANLGGSDRVSRRDLFYPDLKISPPRHPSARTLDTAQLPDFLVAQRARYQRGLLTWLRDPAQASGLHDMRAALDSLDQIAPQLPEPHALWWSAVGMVDGLLHSPRPDWWAIAKALCTKLEFQIRNLVTGKPLDQQVLREVLYALFGCRPVTPRMRDARKRFNLDSLLPAADAEGAAGRDAGWLQAALGEIRTRLEAVKETWVEYVSGKPQQLARFRELVAALKTKANELDNQPLVRLLDVVGLVAGRLPDPYPRDSQLMVMEMASAFLLAESIIEQVDAPPPELDRQIVIMNGWLLDAAKTNTASEPPPGLRADLIQKYNEAHLRAQVSREIVANLQHAEEVLDAFARDPVLLDTLPGLTPAFKQVHGALIMLGFGRASELLSECEKMIGEALAPDVDDTLQDIHWIAEGLSTLGLYLEPCLRGRAPIEEIVARFFERLRQRLAPSTGQSAEQAESTAAKSNPPAETHAASAPRGSLIATTGQALDAGTAETPEEGRTAPATSTAGAGDEMLAIFLEEAEDVLAGITAARTTCTRQNDDRESLTVIRRGFHTLKGSGRMVGLGELGEVAWEIEQVMNRWLEQEHAATPDLLETIDSAIAAFSGWVTKLKAGKPVQIEAAEIVETAQRLRGGTARPAGQRSSPPAALPPDPPPVLPRHAPPAAIARSASGEPGGLSPADSSPACAHPVPGADEKTETPDIDIPTLDAVNFSDDAAPLAVAPARPAGAGAACPAHRAAETPNLESLDFSAAAPDPKSTADETSTRAGESDGDVVVGTVRLISNFYQIYLKEAQEHLRTLDAQYRHGTDGRGRPPSDDFLRAAHTLASISRTAGFEPIAALAGALEAWAAHAQHDGTMEAEAAVTSALSRLNEMVASVARCEPPEAADAAAAVLRHLIQQRGAPPLLHTWVRKAHPAGPSTDTELIAKAANSPQQRDQRAIHDDFDPQLLPIFLEEALELLPHVGTDLRAWRASPRDARAPASLRRALHTLKGSARMAGAMRLGELTHLMESAAESALASGAPQPGTLERLETQMDRLTQEIESLRATAVALAAPDKSVMEAEAAAAPAAAETGSPLSAPAAMLRIGAEALDRIANEAGEISIARSRIEGELRAIKQSAVDLTESITRLRTELREMEIQADSQMQSRMSVLEQERHDFDPLEFDRYTRLQELTRMMAEGLHDVTTVQQNLLKDLDHADAALLHQARISRGLQQELMRVRTVPFAHVAERLHRIVRQSARELGKRANVEIIGSRIEIDRSVLERIAAPLEHLLRNAVAHGLESPPERRLLGKPETGEIGVALRQEGDEIVIVVSDDGAGLNMDKLRQKALDKGLLQRGEEASEDALTELIFAPGFSTADEVTELAGRGVGMDVVRSEIASIGGRIETASTPGKGASFCVYLPLTLAVMQSVLVRGGEHVFAIPSALVEQVLRVKSADMPNIAARGAVDFQGASYPLHNLSRVIGLASPEERHPYQSILLVRAGAHRIAVHVEEIVGNREIVIKNIGPQLSRLPWVSGATVLGDGKIALIVNPVHLAQSARPTEATLTAPSADIIAQQPLVVMVVDDSLTVRKITGRLLEREGYRVLTAKDGVDALEQADATPPDIMLVDIEMPRMDGFDLARNIRANPSTAGVPIIMISSRSAEKHRSHALEAGVNAFIGKPYQDAELLSQIVQFTANRPRSTVYH